MLMKRRGSPRSLTSAPLTVSLTLGCYKGLVTGTVSGTLEAFVAKSSMPIAGSFGELRLALALRLVC